MADLSITGEVVVTSEKAEGAFDRVGAKAGQMASKVQAEATKAGAAVDSIGAGAEQGAEKFTRAESRMRSAIQKSTRELEMLGKTASQKFEAQLEFKGLDKAKFQPFLDELRKAEEATKKAESGLSGLGSAAQAAGRAMAVAFSGAAAFGVVGKLVEVQREFDVLNSSLKTVTGSSAAAERELSWLKTFAKETPFGLAQATQGFVKMKALGLDPTRAALTSFGNTASAMGKDLNQMIEAVADASTGEFERLKEFGIKAKKEGDNVSLTFQGVTTTIKNSASEITKYLEDIGNVQFGGAMAERAKTLDGAISELGDTWDELFRTINERNAGSLIYDSIKLANGAIEDATTIIKAMTAAYDESGQATGAMATIQNGIATVFETVAVLGANLKYVLVQIGNEIGGLAAQVVQAAQFNFAGVRAIREQMVADAEAARREIDATTERILNARKEQEEYARWATRNASAATDPRRVDLGGGTTRAAGGASSGAAKAAKEAISEYDKLIKKLSDELPAASAAAEAAQMGYNKAQAEFLALAASPAWAKFTNDQRATVAALFENKIAIEQSADAAKTLAKANLDAAASREKYLASLSTGLDKIKADTAAQLEATARLGLSKEAIAELDEAKLEMLATDLELQAIKAMDRNLDEQTYNALKQQAEAYRELAAAKKAGATKEMALDLEKANREAAKKAADEWERAADDINRSLTDALLRGFESGKGFAENLRDTLKNMFSTLVLRPIISAAMSPVAGAINGMLYGNAAAAAGGGASALGMLGSGANLINGLQGTQGMLGTVGGWLGLNTVATNAGLAATIGIDAASAAAAANAAGAAGGGLLSGVGAALPWIGGIAALASILGGLDDSGTYHTGGAAQYSGARGLMSGQDATGYNIGFGRVEAGAQTISAVSAIAQGLGTALDGVAVAFGQRAGYEIATAYADDAGSADGGWGALRISREGQELLNWENTRQSRWAPREFGDGEEGYKQYLAAVAKDTRQVLLDMDLPSWADKMLTSIGDSASMEQLSATVQQIAAIKTQFVQLGKAMEMFDGISSGMESALLSAAGSIDALTASAAGYYDAVYTEQEKIARARTKLETTLAGYGQSLPATREQYRALVEQQIAAGESGAEFAVVLMGLAGTFAQVVDDIDAQFADLAKSAADVFSPLLESIKQARADVAGTRANMLKSDQAMTASQIAAAIGAAMVYAPNTAGVVGAQGGVAAAAAQVAASKAAADAAQATASGLYGGLQGSISARDAAASEQARLVAAIAAARANYAKFQDGGEFRNYSYSNRVRNMRIFAAEIQSAQQQLDALQPSLAAYNAAVAAQQAVYDAAQGAANGYAQQLAAAQAALATAQQAEVQARADYAEQLNQFVTAAGGSVSKLSGLREEVVRFYEAQEQAVQSMIATAENLRAVVNGIRMGQLDSAQTAAQLGSSYASDYSMALATTGSTRAGYADSMASTLPTLAEAIKAEASTASDWRVQTGKLLAQATGVAGMLEADASGTDYQTTSLGLLDSIDTALAQLEGSTKSAEQVISQAIKDGTMAQLTGLRAVVAALRGDPIPAFAAGGFHAGGLRLVGENGPELEATGPSRIWSAQQTAALFAGNGQGSNEALVSEIRALRSENQAQAAAMVNMQRELNKLMQRWDSQGMPEERIV